MFSKVASLETSVDTQIKLTNDADHEINALKQQISSLQK